MQPRKSYADLERALQDGEFHPMNHGDYLSFGGASSTTLIRHGETTITLYDPAAPQDGFEFYDYSEQWERTPNQCQCWRITATAAEQIL